MTHLDGLFVAVAWPGDPDVGNLPNFLPTTAAEASSTFAGLLAAITLAVTLQMVFQRDRSGAGSVLSVAVAPPSFVTLVVAAYLYVRLAGRHDQTEEFLAAVSTGGLRSLIDMPTDLFGEAHITVAMFACAGWLLATGGVGTTLLVALAVHENSEDELAHRLASAGFYMGGVCLATIFLLDGVYEIYSVLRIEDLDLSATEYVPPGLARSGWYVIVVFSAVAAVAGWIGFATTRRTLREDAVRVTRQWRYPIGLMLAWSGTVAWSTILDSRSTFNMAGEWDIAYCSLARAAFAAAVGLMAAIERHSWSQRRLSSPALANLDASTTVDVSEVTRRPRDRRDGDARPAERVGVLLALLAITIAWIRLESKRRAG